MINNEDVVKKDIEIFQRQKRRHIFLFFNPLHFLVEVLYFLCLQNVFFKILHCTKHFFDISLEL